MPGSRCDVRSLRQGLSKGFWGLLLPAKEHANGHDLAEPVTERLPDLVLVLFAPRQPADDPYPIFFAGRNASFERGGLSDSAVRSLLDRWATWRWIRTGLGMVGFIAALRALLRS